jgi:hydroxymethylpyrimidine/phosphomethylpyrimidine kinase
MAARPSQPAALTIAGSDSSGGAGLQADLRTLARLGMHGASVVTCVTAQNPGAVTAIHPTPAKVVAAQLDSVFGSLPIRAVKTGMLYSRAIIDAVAGRLAKRQRLSLVVDPVMLSSSGTPLLKPSAATTLANRLFPLAKLVTPNLDEAAALAKRRVREPEEMRDAARAIHEQFGCAVLVKGGHMKTTEAIDLFYDGREEFLLSAPRVRGCRRRARDAPIRRRLRRFWPRASRCRGRWNWPSSTLRRRFQGLFGSESTVFWADPAWPRARFSATFPLFW